MTTGEQDKCDSSCSDIVIRTFTNHPLSVFSVVTNIKIEIEDVSDTIQEIETIILHSHGS